MQKLEAGVQKLEVRASGLLSSSFSLLASDFVLPLCTTSAQHRRFHEDVSSITPCSLLSEPLRLCVSVVSLPFRVFRVFVAISGSVAARRGPHCGLTAILKPSAVSR